MSDPIYGIIERLALIEGKTTPVTVKHGLNPQQKSANQLPALFKPRDISPTLTKKPYQAHPMDGFMVGETALTDVDDLRAKLKALQDIQMDPNTEKDPELKKAVMQRRADLDKEAKAKGLSEAMQEVEEDMLGRMKSHFRDYLETLEKKTRVDQHLIRKAKAELNIDDDPETEQADMEEATWDADVAPPSDPGDSEVAHGIEDHLAAAVAAPAEPMGHINESPVATYAMEDGTYLECWGDDSKGYELKFGDRVLPTKFSSKDHADMAVKLFQKRRKSAQQNQDYLEER